MAVTVQFLPRTPGFTCPGPELCKAPGTYWLGHARPAPRGKTKMCARRMSHAPVIRVSFTIIPITNCHVSQPGRPAVVRDALYPPPVWAQPTGSDPPNSLPPPTHWPKSTPTPPSQHTGHHGEGGSSKKPEKLCPAMIPLFISELGKLVHASKGRSPGSP